MLHHVLLLSVLAVHHVQGYCVGIGSNPGFSGPPEVQQINFTTVLVSWEGLATQKDCADQFLVKSGLVASPTDYKLSEMLSTDTFHMVITDRIPEQKYFYQVIAREDKGWKGVDYNKSPETLFTTSRRKGNLKTNLLPPKPAQIYTTPPTVQELTEGMEYETEAPVSSLKNEESSLVNEYLVWIVVGSLAVILIIVGLVYNIRRRNTRKDIDLDSQIGRRDEWADDDLSDFDDDDDDQREEEEEGKELQSLKSKE